MRRIRRNPFWNFLQERFGVAATIGVTSIGFTMMYGLKIFTKNQNLTPSLVALCEEDRKVLGELLKDT